MRPLLRSSLCALVLSCILFSNSFCGIALAESSTEQVLKYSLADSRAVHNAVSFGGGGGWYDKSNDSISSSFYDVSVNNNKVPQLWVGLDGKDYSSQYLPVYTFHIAGDNLGLTKVSNRYLYNDCQLLFGAGGYNSSMPWFYANPSGLDVFKSYAVVRMSGIVNVGSAWLSISGDSDDYAISTIPLSSVFVPSQVSDFQYDLGIDFSLNIEQPDTVYYRYGNSSIQYEMTFGEYNSNDSWSTFQNFNGQIIDITVYTVFNLSSFAFEDYSIIDYVENNDYVFPLFYGIENADLYIISEDNVPSDTESTIINSISNSISSMGSSISKTVSSGLKNVSTQITNSTSTITSRIESMESNIVNGLNNVISSAQQNTQNIINTVTQKVDEVKTGITEVKDSILDLPNKISEMLIGLVVPDEQTMIEQRDKWDNLLAERFGAVYESVEVMDSIAAAFQSSAETSIITLPSVTVGLAGTDFTFGGYDVEVVPEGFDSLVTALKLIIDIVVTLAFINAMKLRYEQLVSR